MSADVATYPPALPATPPPTPADFKNEEPKIYISTAKLELKLSAIGSNKKDYVWHTNVVQPATETEEVSETLVKQTAASQPVEAVNRDIYTSAQRNGEKPGTLAATLFNFIDVERYHSEKNQLASKGAQSNEKETTYI